MEERCLGTKVDAPNGSCTQYRTYIVIRMEQYLGI